MKRIWAVVTDNSVMSRGLAEKAAELSETGWCSVVVVQPKPETKWSGRVEKVYHIPQDGWCSAYHLSVVKTIADIARRERPDGILFLADDFGHAVAPQLAALLDTGITADCTALDLSPEGEMLQKRPAFGGRRLATIRTLTSPCIATIRPGVFSASLCMGPMPPVEHVEPDGVEETIRVLRRTMHVKPGLKLTQAEIILAGGAGLGSRDAFERLHALADRLGFGTGASRGAVAAGYAPCSAQIGLTGLAVRPRLYVAFGISGTVQHLCGVYGAEKIVSINTDPRASIFRVSDYALVADCVEVLRRIEEKMV